MRYAQLVFSPAGGTQRVADAIVEEWGETVERVDLTDTGMDFSGVRFQEGDLVLIALPSYGGRVPGLAAQRLGQVRANGACCLLVCVYGNRAYEDTLVEMQDLAEGCGFRVLAAAAAIAEHSILHQYAAGRPDAEDIRRLHEASSKMLNKFKESSSGQAPLSLPGNRPYKKAGGSGMVPKAGKGCTGCGLCAKNCPAGAIRMESLESADASRCISCMRCVVNCPQAARKVNKAIIAAASLALEKACSVRKECELFI